MSYFVLGIKGFPLSLSDIYPDNEKDNPFLFDTLDAAIQFRERMIKEKDCNCCIVEIKEIVDYRELGK